MDQWLVRTVENVIAGPFTRDQIKDLILDGQLCLQDEICPGNGDWFYLHEREEVVRFLGEDVVVHLDDGEGETTQTQTETETEIQEGDKSVREAQPTQDFSGTQGDSTRVASFSTGQAGARPQLKRKFDSSAVPISQPSNHVQMMHVVSSNEEPADSSRKILWLSVLIFVCLVAGFVAFVRLTT